jgi:putative chitinase
MDKTTLKKIMPFATDANIDKFLPHLNDTMATFEIDTPMRQAHFLAQIAHESGSLRYVREIASGEAYEGRKDLGNVMPGDGPRFKGRGLIQLTGRTNYKLFDEYTNREYDLLHHPERVEQPGLASLVAGWFWYRNKLNELADRDQLMKITKKINGGYNGLEDRGEHLTRAKAALITS